MYRNDFKGIKGSLTSAFKLPPLIFELTRTAMFPYQPLGLYKVTSLLQALLYFRDKQVNIESIFSKNKQHL